MIYIASMWLEFQNVPEEHYGSAIEAMTTLWPPQNWQTWRDMVVEAETDQRFVDLVNDEFTTNLDDLINYPVEIASVAAPFTYTPGWVKLPNGFHEWIDPVTVNEEAFQLRYRVDGAEQMRRIYAHLRFRRNVTHLPADGGIS